MRSCKSLRSSPQEPLARYFYLTSFLSAPRIQQTFQISGGDVSTVLPNLALYRRGVILRAWHLPSGLRESARTTARTRLDVSICFARRNRPVSTSPLSAFKISDEQSLPTTFPDSPDCANFRTSSTIRASREIPGARRLAIASTSFIPASRTGSVIPAQRTYSVSPSGKGNSKTKSPTGR